MTAKPTEYTLPGPLTSNPGWLLLPVEWCHDCSQWQPMELLLNVRKCTVCGKTWEVAGD